MEITYKTGCLPAPEQVIELYNKAALPRPTSDIERIRKMYQYSNLVVTAWCNDTLVGVSRSITDHAWSCYLADLAVDPGYQKSGIGKKLLKEKLQRYG